MTWINKKFRPDIGSLKQILAAGMPTQLPVIKTRLFAGSILGLFIDPYEVPETVLSVGWRLSHFILTAASFIHSTNTYSAATLLQTQGVYGRYCHSCFTNLAELEFKPIFFDSEDPGSFCYTVCFPVYPAQIHNAFREGFWFLLVRS